jgi:hypothetical protein
VPIFYHIDAKENLVMALGSGVLTDDELLDFRKRLVNDPAFQPNMRELSDFRSVEKHVHSTEGLHRFLEQEIKYADRLGREYRIAIVTGSDLHFGFSRMYIVGVADTLPEVQVFRDIDEAEAWLFSA